MKPEIDSAWAAVKSVLKDLSFHDIKTIAGLAGFGLQYLEISGFVYTLLDEDDYSGWNRPDCDQLISDITCRFVELEDEKKARFLNIVIEELLSGEFISSSNNNEQEYKLRNRLNRLGWQLIDNKVVPVEILDSSDLEELDPAAREDLINAATRFRDGQLSGAITSAYGAVEHVILQVYKNKGLGEIDYNKSFQNRCKKAFEATGVYAAIDNQLIGISWKEGDIKEFKKNLEGSVNHAAYVLQFLRNNMADAHGTKPVIKPLVFDSIKWAQIIVRLLSEKYDEMLT
ncbi:MAG: hypothetical protein ACXW1W_11305 [Methylococcaceae bacterium]